MKKYLLLFSLFVCSLAAGAQTLRGDVNEDGTVDVADITEIINIILHGDEEGDDDDEPVVTPSQPAFDSRAVDLGLSVKWASCNVGAKVPEGYGGYYAWGETEEKGDYSWSTYKYCDGIENTLTKYCTNSYYGTVDNKTTLEPCDDVATVEWGKMWRMPTLAEQDELRNNCTWEWTTLNGVNGWRVTGPSGNSIFLPAAGFRSGSEVSFQGTYGLYWLSTLSSGDSNNASYLYFDSIESYSGRRNRYHGHPVRPVCE